LFTTTTFSIFIIISSIYSPSSSFPTYSPLSPQLSSPFIS
jgi:hypothetical protein